MIKKNVSSVSEMCPNQSSFVCSVFKDYKTMNTYTFLNMKSMLFDIFLFGSSPGDGGEFHFLFKLK